MDKAVFINLGMNTRLITIRMLNKPVVVKTKPGEQLLGETTEFQYERIQLEGFTLEEFLSGSNQGGMIKNPSTPRRANTDVQERRSLTTRWKLNG